MKMKKLGALLLAGVMTMSTLLTGCGNGASGSSAGGNASQTESGSNGERKKITILMRASETSAKYIIMKKLLTDFSEEKGLEPPEFELISGDADYVTKLQLYINSNTLPDIYGCANGALSAAAKDIGGIVNIGDELERVGKKDDMNAAVYDFFKDKDDGNVYLFPEALNCEFFFYRKDIFEKYNLEAPTTWNEFLDTCKTLKDNGEIPLIVAGKENWQLMRYLSFAPWRMTKDPKDNTVSIAFFLFRAKLIRASEDGVIFRCSIRVFSVAGVSVVLIRSASIGDTIEAFFTGVWTAIFKAISVTRAITTAHSSVVIQCQPSGTKQ